MFYFNYVETKALSIKEKAATQARTGKWNALSSSLEDFTMSDNSNLLATPLSTEIMISQQTCPFNSLKASIYSICALWTFHFQ